MFQEVNEMWAGLGYYRRARFLLEVRLWLLALIADTVGVSICIDIWLSNIFAF